MTRNVAFFVVLMSIGVNGTLRAAECFDVYRLKEANGSDQQFSKVLMNGDGTLCATFQTKKGADSCSETVKVSDSNGQLRHIERRTCKENERGFLVLDRTEIRSPEDKLVCWWTRETMTVHFSGGS